MPPRALPLLPFALLLWGGVARCDPVPRFLCTPLPAGADPACPARDGGARDGGAHEEDAHEEDARGAILRLREALVQQREAALELAAKLGRCEAAREGRGGAGSGGGAPRAEEEEEEGAQRALEGLRQRLQQLQSRNVSGLREALQKKIRLLELQLHPHGNGTNPHGNGRGHHGDHHLKHHHHGNQHGGHHHGDHSNHHGNYHGDHEKHGGHHEGLHGNHHGHHGDHGKAEDHGNHHSILHSNHHGHHGDHSKSSDHGILHSNHHGHHGDHSKSSDHGILHGNHHEGLHGNHGHHGDHSKAGDPAKAHSILHSNHHRHHGDHADHHGNHSKPHDHHHHSLLHSNRYGHHGNHHHHHHSKHNNHPFEDHHGNHAGYPHGNHYGNHGNHHEEHHWGHRHGDREDHEEEEDHDDPEDHGDPQDKDKAPPGGFRLSFPLRTNYLFARARGPVLRRPLAAVSACLWLRPGAGPGGGGAPPLGTPFSYAAPGQPNELVLLAWGGRPLELLVNDQAVALSLSPAPGRWHHVCVTWSAAGGTWRSFQDGAPRGRGAGLAPGHALRPHGVLVLGQEQDALGGRFDATQSFLGELSALQLWGRALAPAEVAAVAACSERPRADVLAWAEPALELHGGVTALPFEPCA